MLNHEADKRACNDGERGGLSRKGRKCLIMKQKWGLWWHEMVGLEQKGPKPQKKPPTFQPEADIEEVWFSKFSASKVFQKSRSFKGPMKPQALIFRKALVVGEAQLCKLFSLAKKFFGPVGEELVER